MRVPRHATTEVKLLWTQLCMRMSKYIWTSMWFFFQKLSSAYIFINCTNLSKSFSTPIWIASNYQTYSQKLSWNFSIKTRPTILDQHYLLNLCDFPSGYTQDCNIIVSPNWVEVDSCAEHHSLTLKVERRECRTESDLHRGRAVCKRP